MDAHTTAILALLTEGEARISQPKAGTDNADIIALLSSPKVTVLPMGATSRSDGFANEVAYLAAMRPAEPMRLRDVAGRTSHLRWEQPLTALSGHLANAHRRWGEGWTRRQHARATAARLWYGCPNIILG